MNLRKAAEQALEALIYNSSYCNTHAEIEALRAALAEPEQEPVAWRAVGGSIWGHKGSEDDTPLYEHPPQRKLLTIEEAVAAERDECAKIVERNAAVCIHSPTLWDVLNANALIIRARGNTNE